MHSAVLRTAAPRVSEDTGALLLEPATASRRCRLWRAQHRGEPGWELSRKGQRREAWVRLLRAALAKVAASEGCSEAMEEGCEGLRW
jgi:glycine cleavage system aminomethyltransferase T